MNFQEIITELCEHMYGESWGIVGIVKNPDLHDFHKNNTDMEQFPVEYLFQTGDGDGGFTGNIYLPLDEDEDGYYLYLWFIN